MRGKEVKRRSEGGKGLRWRGGEDEGIGNGGKKKGGRLWKWGRVKNKWRVEVLVCFFLL